MKNIILLFGLFITGCSSLGFGEFDDSNIDSNQSSNNSGEIPVKFTYQPLIGGKHQVYLVGDFNSWSQTATLMKEIDGIYERTLYLKQGKYGYKFIVDGQWITDENAVEFTDDGYGGQNSVIFVGNKKDIDALRRVDFTYHPKNIVKEVYLVGSINDWNLKSDRMLETQEGVYSISLLLKPGEYQYKFLEDGMNYITDQGATSFSDDGFGGQNSVLIVDERYDKINITKGDGLFLDYGISMIQNLESVNPLSPTTIEFKAKAHMNDVEGISLLIKSDSDSQLYAMDRVAEDGSFEYFQKLISKP